MVNDELFRDLDEKEFRLLADYRPGIVAGGERRSCSAGSIARLAHGKTGGALA